MQRLDERTFVCQHRRRERNEGSVKRKREREAMTSRSGYWLCFALLALVSCSLFAPSQAAAQDPARFDVLVFSKTTGFRHTDAITAGIAGIQQMGVAEDFAVTATEDAA